MGEFQEFPHRFTVRRAKSKWSPLNIKLAPGYKKQYVGWLISAKRESTKQKRLEEAIILLEQNKKLGMK